MGGVLAKSMKGVSPSNAASSSGKKTMMGNKQNFKHGGMAQTVETVRDAHHLAMPTQQEREVFQGSVMTTSTIDVQIDRGALANRKDANGDDLIHRVAQARKTEQRIRRAHQECAEFIE